MAIMIDIQVSTTVSRDIGNNCARVLRRVMDEFGMVDAVALVRGFTGYDLQDAKRLLEEEIETLGDN